MYIKRNIGWGLILRYIWKNAIFFTLYTTSVFSIYHFLDWKFIDIPFQPLSVIGIAVAFYIGFKNSQSYDRFWEARKIWGGIVNYSRTWANQVICLVEDNKETKQILIYRHIAWINALRIQLRQPNSFSLKENAALEKLFKKHGEQKPACDEAKHFISEKEYLDLVKRKNAATHIIKNQGLHLKQLLEEGKITEFDKQLFHNTLEEFYNLQGKCERIKNTPFPRQYAYFSTLFTWIFILLLPFGLLNVFENELNEMNHDIKQGFIFLMVPLSVLISWIFFTMEKIGSNSEDPFEGRANDVPITALCKTIEIDLRDMLNEKDLPEKEQPKDNILY
ncbi:putative membrane protein [Aquimarina sp. MAR_2010_214]|uniref:bestrophin family protein n=1 Tax=Aquimarina sp. MAR_2010_214 TaxID=1250026 RepID=UPI000C70FB57|nr:bestrophin family ion channel [Aquimarina sp. MAR_2010_214]PKV49048.1 putative membrane protein [Aquimarina sp. MAR_2010_214]